MEATHAGGKVVYIKEPWLEPGPTIKWTKWTLNDGTLLPGRQSRSSFVLCRKQTCSWWERLYANPAGARKQIPLPALQGCMQ